ncbi:LysM peptidoglycan-binding domain-containing protein [Georhizobium profundi]|nr:LysM peptidoglycan-binding domain-containing protein [Georhizobium profundi]
MSTYLHGMSILNKPMMRPVNRRIGGAFVAAAMVFSAAPLPGFGTDALAQCTARTQTGVGTNAVALAQRCGTTVGDLRRANPGRDLNQPGLLRIPGGRTSAVPDSLNNEIAPRQGLNATRQAPVVQPSPTFRQPGEAPMRRSSPDAGGNGSYAIRRGDTLSGIAASAGVPLNALMRANPGIQPNRLSVGQAIVIPAS